MAMFLSVSQQFQFGLSHSEIPEAQTPCPAHIPWHRWGHGGHNVCRLCCVGLTGHDLCRQARIFHPSQPGERGDQQKPHLVAHILINVCRLMSGVAGSWDLQHSVLFLHLLPQLGYVSHHKHTGERWRTHAGTNVLYYICWWWPTGQFVALYEISSTSEFGDFLAALRFVHQPGRSDRPTADWTTLLFPSKGWFTVQSLLQLWKRHSSAPISSFSCSTGSSGVHQRYQPPADVPAVPGLTRAVENQQNWFCRCTGWSNKGFDLEYQPYFSQIADSTVTVDYCGYSSL